MFQPVVRNFHDASMNTPMHPPNFGDQPPAPSAAVFPSAPPLTQSVPPALDTATKTPTQERFPAAQRQSPSAKKSTRFARSPWVRLLLFLQLYPKYWIEFLDSHPNLPPCTASVCSTGRQPCTTARFFLGCTGCLRNGVLCSHIDALILHTVGKKSLPPDLSQTMLYVFNLYRARAMEAIQSTWGGLLPLFHQVSVLDKYLKTLETTPSAPVPADTILDLSRSVFLIATNRITQNALIGTLEAMIHDCAGIIQNVILLRVTSAEEGMLQLYKLFRDRPVHRKLWDATPALYGPVTQPSYSSQAMATSANVESSFTTTLTPLSEPSPVPNTHPIIESNTSITATDIHSAVHAYAHSAPHVIHPHSLAAPADPRSLSDGMNIVEQYHGTGFDAPLCPTAGAPDNSKPHGHIAPDGIQQRSFAASTAPQTASHHMDIEDHYHTSFTNAEDRTSQGTINPASQHRQDMNPMCQQFSNFGFSPTNDHQYPTSSMNVVHTASSSANFLATLAMKTFWSCSSRLAPFKMSYLNTQQATEFPMIFSLTLDVVCFSSQWDRFLRVLSQDVMIHDCAAIVKRVVEGSSLSAEEGVKLIQRMFEERRPYAHVWANPEGRYGPPPL
ncbi:hypothetical protein CC2G_000241 [Coprinopsis cinerea AmutBmut pab1-1]|nr:hypothetical protein CC2G_000241 [Coprinopsis cinerea AmutBmut pab1-1]